MQDEYADYELINLTATTSNVSNLTISAETAPTSLTVIDVTTQPSIVNNTIAENITTTIKLETTAKMTTAMYMTKKTNNSTLLTGHLFFNVFAVLFSFMVALK